MLNMRSGEDRSTKARIRDAAVGVFAERGTAGTTARAVAEAMGLQCFADPRYEADDLIGTLAGYWRARGHPICVVNDDKDLAQLVGENDHWWDFSRNRKLDARQLTEKFGVQPWQIADYLALTGDAVDNIPGVPGVGPKTAGALMREFSSLESLFDNLEAVTRLPVRGARGIANRLREHRDTAFLARRLTRIETDMALSVDEKTLSRRRPDLQGLYRLYDELGFGPRMRREAEEIAETF